MSSEDLSNAKASSDQNYLVERYDKPFELHQEDVLLECRVTGINNFGFSVKTSGLFAFIYFRNMPWQYPRKEYWEIIYKPEFDLRNR